MYRTGAGLSYGIITHFNALTYRWHLGTKIPPVAEESKIRVSVDFGKERRTKCVTWGRFGRVLAWA
jgi:hypothetical protein